MNLPSSDSEAVRASPSPLRRAWQSWPGSVARFAIALLPLWWLSRRIDWSEVFSRASALGPVPLALSFACIMGSVTVGAFRWRVMLKAYGAEHPPSVLTLLHHNLVGQYFNVLPSGVAGDAVRGLRVHRSLGSLPLSYIVLFVERLAGLLGLCLIAAAAFALTPGLLDGLVATAFELALLAALGLSSVVLALPYVLSRAPGLRHLVSRIPIIGPMILRIPPARSMRGVLFAVVLSVFTQGTVILAIATLIGRLSTAATLLVCARITPAIILFTYIPLTPGGLGQREWAFVTLFNQVGVAPSASLAASLLYFGISLSVSAVGGLALLSERFTRSSPSPQSSEHTQ